MPFIRDGRGDSVGLCIGNIYHAKQTWALKKNVGFAWLSKWIMFNTEMLKNRKTWKRKESFLIHSKIAVLAYSAASYTSSITACTQSVACLLSHLAVYCECWMFVCERGSGMSDSLWSHGYQPMDFSRSEYWSGEPFPSPGDLRNPGIELGSLHRRQILYQQIYKLDISCKLLFCVMMKDFSVNLLCNF